MIILTFKKSLNYSVISFFILLFIVTSSIEVANAEVLGTTISQSITDSDKAKNPATIIWSKDKDDSTIFSIEGALKIESVSFFKNSNYKLTPFIETKLSTEFDKDGKRKGNEFGLHIRKKWQSIKRDATYKYIASITTFIKTDYSFDARIIGLELRYSPLPNLKGLIHVIPLNRDTSITFEWEPTIGINISNVIKKGTTALEEESIWWLFGEIGGTTTFFKLNELTLVGKLKYYKIQKGFDEDYHLYFEGALNIPLVKRDNNKAIFSITYKNGEKSTDFKENESLQIKLGVIF